MPEPEWISPEEALRRYGKALDEDEPGKKGKAPKSKRISPSGRSNRIQPTSCKIVPLHMTRTVEPCSIAGQTDAACFFFPS